MATFASVLDLAHKMMDHLSSGADASDEPDPKPTPTKNTGLHPGEGKQIDDLDLMGGVNSGEK